MRRKTVLTKHATCGCAAIRLRVRSNDQKIYDACNFLQFTEDDILYRVLREATDCGKYAKRFLAGRRLSSITYNFNSYSHTLLCGQLCGSIPLV